MENPIRTELVNTLQKIAELASTLPLFDGIESPEAHQDALRMLAYILENDDTHPLLDALIQEIENYERKQPQYQQFDREVAALGMPQLERVVKDNPDLPPNFIELVLNSEHDAENGRGLPYVRKTKTK